jgi:hypothetical protein
MNQCYVRDQQLAANEPHMNIRPRKGIIFLPLDLRKASLFSCICRVENELGI